MTKMFIVFFLFMHFPIELSKTKSKLAVGKNLKNRGSVIILFYFNFQFS